MHLGSYGVCTDAISISRHPPFVCYETLFFFVYDECSYQPASRVGNNSEAQLSRHFGARSRLGRPDRQLERNSYLSPPSMSCLGSVRDEEGLESRMHAETWKKRNMFWCGLGFISVQPPIKRFHKPLVHNLHLFPYTLDRERNLNGTARLTKWAHKHCPTDSAAQLLILDHYLPLVYTTLH